MSESVQSNVDTSTAVSQSSTPSSSSSNVAAPSSSSSASSALSSSSPVVIAAPLSAPIASTTVPHAANPAVYNPNVMLSQLDASLTPDESENARLTQVQSQSLTLMMATKRDNDNRQHEVGRVLAAKYARVEAEARALATIRAELAALDQHLSRSIDVLRAEIENCGREVNTYQRDFDSAEIEYLKCRKSLAKSKHRKLLLTSHLDVIILAAETDKAKKLAELEINLGLSASNGNDNHQHQQQQPQQHHRVTSIEQNANGRSGNYVSSTTTSSSSSASSGSPPRVNVAVASVPIVTGATASNIAAAAASDARRIAAAAALANEDHQSGLRMDTMNATVPSSSSSSSMLTPFGQSSDASYTSRDEARTLAMAFTLGLSPSTVPIVAAQQSSSSFPSFAQPAVPSASAASIAAARHIAFPSRASIAAATSTAPSSSLSSSSSYSPARGAQSSMSIAGGRRTQGQGGTQHTSDGSFAGFE